MNAITSPLSRERLIAIADNLRQWLMMGLAALAEVFDGTPLGATLRVWVRWYLADMEFRMKMRLFALSALAGPRVLGRPRPPLPPFRPPAGVRRHVQRGHPLRHFTRGLFPRAGIAQRIARLRHLLKHPEAAIARIRARMARGLVNGRLMLRTAQRCVLTARSAPRAPFADTS